MTIVAHHSIPASSLRRDGELGVNAGILSMQNRCLSQAWHRMCDCTACSKNEKAVRPRWMWKSSSLNEWVMLTQGTELRTM